MVCFVKHPSVQSVEDLLSNGNAEVVCPSSNDWVQSSHGYLGIHSTRMSCTCSASSLVSQKQTKSSAYLTTARFPMSSPRQLYLTPMAASIPCNAMFANNGDPTPPWGVPCSVA